MWIEFAVIVVCMVVVLILGMLVVSFPFLIGDCVYSFCRHDTFPLEV